MLTRKSNGFCITDEYPNAIDIAIPQTITPIGKQG